MTSFPYSGSKINSSASLDDEIVNWIAKAGDTFGKLQAWVLSEKGLSMRMKISVFHAVVTSVLLYGFESWAQYRKQIMQPITSHKMSLSFTWKEKVSDKQLFDECYLQSVEAFLMQSQFRPARLLGRVRKDCA